MHHQSRLNPDHQRPAQYLTYQAPLGKNESHHVTNNNESHHAETISSPLKAKLQNIEALSFTMPGSRLRELRHDLISIHREISIASSVADACLTILIDVFGKMEEIMRHSLIDDFFQSFEQLVVSFKEDYRTDMYCNLASGTETPATEASSSLVNKNGSKVEEEVKKLSSSSPLLDSRVDSVNRAVTRMLSWSYSPWLMLPDLGNVDESSVTALSIRDQRTVECSIGLSLRLAERGRQRLKIVMQFIVKVFWWKRSCIDVHECTGSCVVIKSATPFHFS
jgi:hypothetical protein